MSSVVRLRRAAISQSLSKYAWLGDAVAAKAFVQADPIRAPARAQDLIMRHRLAGYKAGDMDRGYARANIEEGYLHAYGFLARCTMRLLHPRHDPNSPNGRYEPTGLAADILAFIRERGASHPRSLELQFGVELARNGWGGSSRLTTRLLQQLHHYGLLRVARRERGIRVYDLSDMDEEDLAPRERFARLILILSRLLSPVPEATLRTVLRQVACVAPNQADQELAFENLLASGALESGTVDGVRYLWPVGEFGQAAEETDELRFLAPFDPIVWDRRRFEHLWGWRYRFEAYTPPPLRRLGYYAMPMLWRDGVIGWANCAVVGRRLRVATGFIAGVPSDPEFGKALESEAARMADFLGVHDVTVDDR